MLLLFLIVIVTTFLVRVTSRGQSQERPQKTQLICCNLLLTVPGTWIGASRDCENYMNNANGDVRADVCRQLGAAGLVCADTAKYCSNGKPPGEKNCEKPNPWFSNSSNCMDVQNPVVAINAGAVTLSICGSPVFRWATTDKDPLLLESYKYALRDWVKSRVGTKICCDKFREAARSGVPCYPAADVDCDGKPNQTDLYNEVGTEGVTTVLPDINNLFSKAEGASVDPFPLGLDPDDPNFLPPQDKCGCKWELVKGSLHCSPDGKQRHFYEARWKCPSTGNERYTRKYAAATSPCPTT